MKASISSRNYVTILGWMVTDLHLKGNELMVYAIIHGFSQDGETTFTGSISYLQEWTGLSRRAVIYILQRLHEKGVIEKLDKTVNGVHLCEYKIAPVVQKLHGGGAKIAPNNNSDITSSSKEEDISISNPLPPKNFNFRSALLGLGVSKEAADAWLQVRKAKRAVNTEIAFRNIAAEIAKAGKPADECIRIAVTKSWAGFSADWLEERSTRPASGTERNGKKTAVDRMLELASQMAGTQTPSCDEQ